MHTENGSRAQTWSLGPQAPTVPDGPYLVSSTIDPSVGVAASAAGCSMAASPQPLSFSYDAAAGLYRISAAGDRLLTLSGSRVVLASGERGDASQLWSVEPRAGGWAIVSAADGRALDDWGSSVTPGSTVGVHTENGSRAQTWSLGTPN